MSANTAPKPELVALHIDAGIATLSLQQAERRNSLNPSMAQALLQQLRTLSKQADQLNAVFLRAQGDHFMVGGDIQFFAHLLASQSQRSGLDQPLALEPLAALIDTVAQVCELLQALPCPVIAYTQGSVAGAGLSLALACDLIMASDDSRFIMAYSALGATPDGGASWTLPQRVGQQRALHMYLLNQPLTAEQALQYGLIAELVPRAQLEHHAQQLAQHLRQGSRQAQNAGKALLRHSPQRSLEQALEAEKQQFLALAQHADFHEGVHAFLQKRPPTFKA